MNKKKIILIIAVLFLGIYLGTLQSENNTTGSVVITKKYDANTSSNEKIMENDNSNNAQSDNDQRRHQNITFKKPYYKKNEYLKELLNDPNFIEVYNKSKLRFKNYEFSEDLAVWLSIGVVFDSSSEYGELFETSISKLNDQKNEVFTAITKETKAIGPEDSFLRQQLINVVGVMDIKKDKKISFFGSEASRKVVLDENGEFSPDSMNITNSIAFLKQSGSSIDEARKFFEQSISINTDPKIQEELKVRFNTYFPGAVNL